MESTVNIHSARFYDVQPKAIHSMCYEDGRLALSRSDNSIEIWNMEHAPHIEKLVPGSVEGSVEALTWSKGRLFSTGLHGFIVEYDLVRVCPKASYAVTSGSAWCLAVNKQHTHLAAGTEEGYVCIFEIYEDCLTYFKVLDKQEGRILSLAWHSIGDFMVTGSADAIRVWNVTTGHAVHRMAPGRTDRKRETLVWCIAITDDFVIISGDSTGMTSFWDGKMGTLIDQVPAHKADVLCLCLSEDQQTVYSAGVDPVIVLFTRVTLVDGRRKWIRSLQRAIHTHDVRSLALAGPKLISGGVDTYLSISSYPPKSLTKYPPLPPPPCVQVAKERRSLLLCHPRSLDVWQLGVAHKEPGETVVNDTFLKIAREPVHMLQLHSKDDEWIICSAISPNASSLVYCTESCVRFYQIDQADGAPKLSRVTVSVEVQPCQRIKFIDHKQLLVATANKTVEVWSVTAENIVKVSHSFGKEEGLDAGDCIHLMDTTSDGKYACVADHHGNIFVLDLQFYKLHSKMPRYKSHPTALAFNPAGIFIVVAYSDHKVIEYDVRNMQYTDFSRNLHSYLPLQWHNRSSCVRHITYNVKVPSLIMLHDDSVICTINKEAKLREPDAKLMRVDNGDYAHAARQAVQTKLQDDEDQDSGRSFGLCKKYKHLAFLGSVATGELVAVEVSPVSFEKHLPPALYKKRFGV